MKSFKLYYNVCCNNVCLVIIICEILSLEISRLVL